MENAAKQARPKAIGHGKLLDVCDCYVLDGGVRVLSKRGLMALLGDADGSGPKNAQLGRSLERLPNRFANLAAGPNIEFILPGGRVGHAVDVATVIEICSAYDEADDAGELRANQVHLARNARRLLRAAARVGLTALVDEATGYDAVRARGDLHAMLRTEIGEWEETFTQSLVRELCRLGIAGSKFVGWNGGRYPQPLASAFFTIYCLILGPDGARALKAANPEPRHKRNHHQWLTPEVREVFKRNMGIIAFCARTSNSRAEFWARLRDNYRGQRRIVYG